MCIPLTPICHISVPKSPQQRIFRFISRISELFQLTLSFQAGPAAYLSPFLDPVSITHSLAQMSSFCIESLKNGILLSKLF